MNHITKDIKYVGVNDHQLDLFEGQFIVPEGMAYNSYVILDEKTAVLDSVDAHFGEEWMNNLKEALAGRTHSEVVQVIGKKIVLYRPAKEEKNRKIILPRAPRR